MSIFTSCYFFLTFLHTPLTPSGLDYLMRSCESMLWKRLYLTTALSYLNEKFGHFLSRDLGVNLLAKAFSGLLDGLLQLEVL